MGKPWVQLLVRVEKGAHLNLSFYGHVSGSECCGLWNVIQRYVCGLMRELVWLAGALGSTLGLLCDHSHGFHSLLSSHINKWTISCQIFLSSSDCYWNGFEPENLYLPLKGEIGWAPISRQPFRVSPSRPVFEGETTKSVCVSFHSPLWRRFLIGNTSF